jgi:serine-type D-Ala-D-Ala carboxypeptidase/endopeptidase (penicillin-binding protein 4)
MKYLHRVIGARGYIFLLVITLVTCQMVFSRQAESEAPVLTSEDSARSIKSVSNEIRKILASNEMKNTEFGVMVYSLDNKKLFYSKNADKQLTPASLTKLFTSVAALVSLGSDFYIRTSVYYDSVINEGVLEGNLYLVGRGDGVLKGEDIALIAKQISAHGIKEIKGSIFADGSYFDDVTSRMKYAGDNDVVQNTPPITALAIERNVLNVIINPGARDNFPVEVKLVPESDYFIKDNKARTFGSAKNKKPTDKQGVTLSLGDKSANSQKITVSGTVKIGETVNKQFDIDDPDLVAAGTLRYYLGIEGIKIEGNLGKKKYEQNQDNKHLLGEFKRPLTEILATLIKESDNYLAETVFKIIGAHYGKYENTAKSARERIAFVLDSIGIPMKNCTLNDGSGLSRRNAVPLATFIKLLETADKLKLTKKFDSLLAVAGIDGTLKNRFEKSLAENNLVGKTGTLKNVSGLAGYVHTLDGEKLAFVFLFNGNSVGNYKRAENKIGKVLSQFFYFNNIE